MSRRQVSRRVAAAALAVLGVAGLSAAAATQLSLGTGPLQSGVASLGDCQPSAQALAVSLTSAFSGGQYMTTGLTVSNIAAACQGKSFRIQMAGPAGAPVGSLISGTVAGTSITSTFTGAPTTDIVSVFVLFAD